MGSTDPIKMHWRRNKAIQPSVAKIKRDENYHAKLTQAQVEMIKSRRKRFDRLRKKEGHPLFGYPVMKYMSALARRYNVSRETIYYVLRKEKK